jgi:hypothetical protein
LAGLKPVLSEHTTIELDTNPFIYLFEHHPRYFPLIEELFSYLKSPSSHHLRVRTQDNLGNGSAWTTLFTLQSPKGRHPYDDQPPTSAIPSRPTGRSSPPCGRSSPRHYLIPNPARGSSPSAPRSSWTAK